MTTKIILASSSPRRVELLKQIGIEFEIFPPEVDESIDSDLAPEDIVMELSERKAMYVGNRVSEDALIISADTIVVKDSVLGKPADEKEAFRMLMSLQNSWHNVITGISLFHTRSSRRMTSYEKTCVKMRPLSDEMIKSYIEKGEFKDKAGAYAIQGIGALLVEKIDGCYFNVVGLPLAKLNTMMENMNIRVL